MWLVDHNVNCQILSGILSVCRSRLENLVRHLYTDVGLWSTNLMLSRHTLLLYLATLCLVDIISLGQVHGELVAFWLFLEHLETNFLDHMQWRNLKFRYFVTAIQTQITAAISQYVYFTLMYKCFLTIVLCESRNSTSKFSDLTGFLFPQQPVADV